jgi:hypothetical protein
MNAAAERKRDGPGVGIGAGADWGQQEDYDEDDDDYYDDDEERDQEDDDDDEAIDKGQNQERQAGNQAGNRQRLVWNEKMDFKDMEGTEEVQEENEVLGRPIADLTCEDFGNLRWARAERRQARPTRMPLEYRLAAAYVEKRHGMPLSQFVHYKRPITKTRRNNLHREAASKLKYVNTGVKFDLVDRNARMERGKKRRRNGIVMMQRHMQAIVRNCLEGYAVALRAGNTDMLPLLDDIFDLGCGCATDLRTEVQYIDDPDRARAAKKKPENREQAFDEEDDKTVDENLAEQERLAKLRGRQQRLKNNSSRDYSFFGFRPLGGFRSGRGRGRIPFLGRRDSFTPGRDQRYGGASYGGGSRSRSTSRWDRNKPRGDSNNNKGWQGSNRNSSSNSSRFGKKDKFKSTRGGKGNRG